jgi:hypothetical protein
MPGLRARLTKGSDQSQKPNPALPQQKGHRRIGSKWELRYLTYMYRSKSKGTSRAEGVSHSRCRPDFTRSAPTENTKGHATVTARILNIMKHCSEPMKSGKISTKPTRVPNRQASSLSSACSAGPISWPKDSRPPVPR